MGSLGHIQFPVFTFQEYLERNERSQVKLEFLHGTVFAMAGGSQFHNAIAMNCGVALGVRLRGGNCRAMSPDQMISTPGEEAAFYPDLTVICGERLSSRAKPMTAPLLVLEVLSPSTRAFDLSEKLKQYKRIPALRHIVFVDSSKVEILLYSRKIDEVWPASGEVFQELSEALPLQAFDLELPLTEIYQDVDFAT